MVGVAGGGGAGAAAAALPGLLLLPALLLPLLPLLGDHGLPLQLPVLLLLHQARVHRRQDGMK